MTNEKKENVFKRAKSVAMYATVFEKDAANTDFDKEDMEQYEMFVDRCKKFVKAYEEAVKEAK